MTPQVRYVRFKSKRHFGIELEVNERVQPTVLVKAVSSVDPDHSVAHSSSYQQDYGNTYWHVKFDRSCSDMKDVGGWEIASYKASGYKDVELMGKVAQALKSAGATVNNNCGFHIHVEVADFKTEQIISLAAHWLIIEGIILEMLPRHRRNHKYAKPMSTFFAMDFNKTYTPAKFWGMVCPSGTSNEYRRVALNLCNFTHGSRARKTVELRLPEGTVDSKEVKNWIRFFVHFVDVVKKKPFPPSVKEATLYEAMKIVGLHGEDPFLILSKGLRETKMWFMDRILLHSSKTRIREEAKKFLNGMSVNQREKGEVRSIEKQDKIRAWHKEKQDKMRGWHEFWQKMG